MKAGSIGSGYSLPLSEVATVKNSTGVLPLDLRDTAVLKAVGIVAIVLHNFYHKLPGTPRENEFDFNPERFQHFLSSVAVPQQAFQSLLSAFGHLGVQLFIFLSAYGLAIKYWSIPESRSFVWSRIKKIYPTFFLALALWLALKLMETRVIGFPSFLHKTGDDLVLTVLGVISLVPGYDLPPVGPWWFLPFIVQFYCIWRGLAAFSRRFGLGGLAALSLASVAILMLFEAPLNQRYAINLLETPLGHLPELCLGVAYARFGARVGPVAALVALGVFIAGNLSALLWPLTFVSALAIMLYGYSLTGGALRNRRSLEWVADVSMPVFFVNGFLRGPFLALAARFDVWYVDLLLGFCVVLFSLAVGYVLLRVEGRLSARPFFRLRHLPGGGTS
jgi:peptidoglycan/LPS O-acetylase OafA/YrhL